MYYICSSVMNLVVLVSFDALCIIIMTYELRQLCNLNPNSYCISICLMYPVSIITHVLNILVTFNTGVTHFIG